MLTRKAIESREYRDHKSVRDAATFRAEAMAREALRQRSENQVEWREEWLASAVQALYPVFAERGYSLPHKLRVSLGWPRQKKHIGSCHCPSASDGGYVEIFISPVLASPVEVLDTLTHELCHAAVGAEHGHKRPFVQCARAMDLRGAASAAGGEGHSAWHQWADPLLSKLGPFPHDAMTLPEPVAAQTTRNLKRCCSACGFTMRAAAVWLMEEGLRCPRRNCEGELR